MHIFIFFLSLCTLTTTINGALEYQPTLENALWYAQQGCQHKALQQIIKEYSENRAPLIKQLNPVNKPTALLYTVLNNDFKTAALLFEEHLVDKKNLWNQSAYLWALALEKKEFIDLLRIYSCRFNCNQDLEEINIAYHLKLKKLLDTYDHPVIPSKSILLATACKRDFIDQLRFLKNIDLPCTFKNLKHYDYNPKIYDTLHYHGFIDENTYQQLKLRSTTREEQERLILMIPIFFAIMYLIVKYSMVMQEVPPSEPWY